MAPEDGFEGKGLAGLQLLKIRSAVTGIPFKGGITLLPRRDLGKKFACYRHVTRLPRL